MKTDPYICPLCFANLRGEPIAADDSDWYGDDIRYYSRIIGVVIPGAYDGVLFWECPDCHGRWHRFPAGTRLWSKAESHINQEVARVRD